jgi:hypothetical protein
MVCARFYLESRSKKRHLWKWEAMGNKPDLSSKLKVAGSNPAGVANLASSTDRSSRELRAWRPRIFAGRADIQSPKEGWPE